MRETVSFPNQTWSPSATDSWITPLWLIERLGPFDLDPCQCDPQPWPCAREGITKTQDGLKTPWPKKAMFFCNPPYGRQTGSWLKLCADHGNGISLVFARTDTKMFFDDVWPKAHLLLFLKGRLTFHQPDGTRGRKGHNSGGPSVLISFGKKGASRLHRCADLGALVLPPISSLGVVLCRK